MLRDLTGGAYRALRALITRTVVMQCDRMPFRFEDVPLRKILNWILVEASMLVKPERPWGWPTHLQVEPEATCNLRCVICPVTTGMGRPTGSMSLDTFRRLIDEVGAYVFLILLWDWGEPLLNPSLFEMISYARRKGIKVLCSTNGQLLAQGDLAERLVRSGLDALIVAMDGISQETYQLYREGGNLESVLKGVENIVVKKRELRSDRPLVNLRFLAMRHNEHEIPRLEGLAKSLGVDMYSVKTLNTYGSDMELVPQNPQYRRFVYSGCEGGRVRRRHNPCRSLWNAPAIHWNGTVARCTFDSGEEYDLGNLTTDSFKDIWCSAKYGRLRRQFRADWESIALCNTCSYAYEGGSCIDEIIAEATFFETACTQA